MTVVLIISDAKQISEAETATLIAAYNQLTGKAVTRFSSRAAGERQVEMALLAAKDLAGHRGVARGEEPSAANGLPEGASPSPEVETPPAATGMDEPPRPFVTNTGKKYRMKRKPAPPKEPGIMGKVGFVAVQVINEQTNFNKGSVRSKVFDVIAKAPNRTIDMVTLNEICGFNARPHVQKLIETQYVRPFPDRRVTK